MVVHAWCLVGTGTLPPVRLMVSTGGPICPHGAPHIIVYDKPAGRRMAAAAAAAVKRQQTPSSNGNDWIVYIQIGYGRHNVINLRTNSLHTCEHACAANRCAIHVCVCVCTKTTPTGPACYLRTRAPPFPLHRRRRRTRNCPRNMMLCVLGPPSRGQCKGNRNLAPTPL